ncbi:RNA-directed DNA polymerase, eukaryota [Tanacetum coccineum]
MAVKFKKKLQQLKISIKSWRCDVQSSDSAAIVTLCNSLDVLDLKAETIPLSPNKAIACINIIKGLTALEHAKILDLHQKEKVRWVRDGDENSRFFHGMINSNSNRVRINVLNISGSWITDPVTIKEHIFQSFESKHEEEIKDAVWDCGDDKAPSPDGFTFKFIKKHWDVIKDDIFAYVKEFELTSFIWRGCNSSFITLILKVDDPFVIGDFRLISLIGFQYKIIAKILANLFAHVISSVIGEVQMAFIKGRQIIDGPLIVDEIISWVKKHKKRLMFCQVDFEKAFDTLNRSFFESIMEQMDFSLKWRNWISSCLNSAFASVLINGSPTKEFNVEKGLRQVFSIGWLLEEIHVTWAHLEKKRTRIRTYTKSHNEFCKQWMETASQA